MPAPCPAAPKGHSGVRDQPRAPRHHRPSRAGPMPSELNGAFLQRALGLEEKPALPGDGRGKKGAWSWPQHPTSPWSCWGACPGPAAGWVPPGHVAPERGWLLGFAGIAGNPFLAPPQQLQASRGPRPANESRDLQKKTRTTKARGRAQRRRMKMLGQTPLRHAGGRDRRQKQLWERKKKKQQPSLLLSFRGRIPIDMDAAARCPPPARLAGFSFSGHAAGEQREEGSSWPIRRVSCAVWLAESSLGAHLQLLHMPRAAFWGIPTAHVVREPQSPAAPAGMQAGSSALQGCLRVLFRQGYTYHFLKAG